MTLTDKTAIRISRNILCPEVQESIDGYPDNERDGRSDLQFIADEISYYISCFEEEGHAMYNALEEARELLRETKNGTQIPINAKTMKPAPGYYPSDISAAKDVINEYKQLKYYKKNLAWSS